MKATVKRTLFLETLDQVKDAVSKNMMLLSSSVLIQTGKGRITLTTSSSLVALTASCKATVGQQGAVAIPASLVETFVRAATAETITLLAEGWRLRIEAGGGVTTLEGFDAREFPPIPSVQGPTVIASGLADALREISYAVATEESRPILTGVCFLSVDNRLDLAAADGFRLAHTSIDARGKLDSMVVVSKAVHIIEKLMPGTVEICRDSKDITFTHAGLTLTTPPIQGTYPQYDKIIPRDGKPCTLDSQALRDALDMVSVTLGGSGIVRLQKRDSNLVLSTHDEELGESRAEVSADGECQIAFSIKYLRDLLSKVTGQISLSVTSPNTPMLVKQGQTVHVLMPMFVEW
jgi:DNA polymerase-3 subunit beta